MADAARLAEIPTDWLEAFAEFVSDRYDLSPDERLARRVIAAVRMRDIEQREGRDFTAASDQGLAELARRKAAQSGGE